MGGSFVADQDLTRWALGVPLPRSPHIGTDRVGRVLVALVQYADSDGIAWPSAERLADDVSGISRRDARSALDLLAGAGLIAPAEAPTRGRARRWKVGPREVAGIPATTLAEHLAGIPATSESVNVAGDMAGNLAGNMAGIPAPNRTEEKKPPTPTSHAAVVLRPETEQAEESAGHVHEPFARRALTRLKLAHRLGLSDQFLLDEAYRLGGGDPHAGAQQIAHLLEQGGLNLATRDHPDAYLKAALRKLEARKPRVTSEPEMCRDHGRYYAADRFAPCAACDRGDPTDAEVAAAEQHQEDAA